LVRFIGHPFSPRRADSQQSIDHAAFDVVEVRLHRGDRCLAPTGRKSTSDCLMGRGRRAMMPLTS